MTADMAREFSNAKNTYGVIRALHNIGEEVLRGNRSIYIHCDDIDIEGIQYLSDKLDYEVKYNRACLWYEITW